MAVLGCVRRPVSISVMARLARRMLGNVRNLWFFHIASKTERFDRNVNGASNKFVTEMTIRLDFMSLYCRKSRQFV